MDIGTDLGSTLSFFVFTGYFAGLFLHHLILYGYTNEKIHLYYFTYILLLFMAVSGTQQVTLFPSALNTLFLQLFHVGLILFTVFVTEIKQLWDALYRTTLWVAVAVFAGLGTFYFTETMASIAYVLSAFSYLYTLFLSLYALKRGVQAARLYLWATLPLFVPILLHAVLHGGLIEHTQLVCNTIVFGAMWNMVILSFILARKTRQRQEEQACATIKKEAESDILFLQSRYASMGETVGNIAHQWKQPLNAIGAIQTGIKATLLYQGDIAKEKLLGSVDSSFRILRHLAETIDTFYGFLSQRDTHRNSFTVAEELEKIRKLTEYSFENSDIALRFDIRANPEIEGNANEFTHALLNLIINAKDAFDDTDVEAPRITVCVEGGEATCTVTVSDNAGGIRIDPPDMIFNLHVTSKEEGSGLGLFMTRNIIETRFGGTINVENADGGARFTLELPYKEYKKHPAPLRNTDDTDSLSQIRQLTQMVIELEELEKTFKKWADTFWQVEWGLVIYSASDHSVELFNPALAQMHGYESGELFGQPVETLFAPESKREWDRANAIISQKGHHTFEATDIRKDGTLVPVTFDISEIKDEAGESRFFIASVRDITEQKAADELLRLKRFALNHIRDEVFLIDEHGRFHYVNAGACETLGYSREALLQMHVGDIDPDYPADAWPALWNMVKKEKNILLESRHQRHDGTIFPVEVSGDYFEYSGKGYILAIARDITERRIAEEKKSDERMRLFFERQLVGMAITSPTKGWLKVNRKLEEMLGYSFEELRKMTWAEVTHPDDLAGDVEQFEQLLAGEIDHYFYEKRYIRKDGTVVYANLSIGCVRKEDKSVDYLIVLIEDITERKKAEAEIARLHIALESVRDGAIIVDREARIQYVNAAACDLWGYRRDELISRSLFDITTDINENTWNDHWKNIKAAGGSALVETLNRTKPGEMIPVEVSITIFESDGKAYNIAMVRDITERKQMEASLRKNREFLAEAQHISHTGSWEFDLQTQVLEWSDEIFNIFEIDKNRCKPSYATFLEAVHPDDRDSVREAFDTSVAQHAPYEIEHRLLMPDGRIKHVLERGETRYGEDGQALHTLGTVHDITERKRMEQELADSHRFLNELIDGVADPIFVKDRQHNWIMLNEAFCTFIGQPRDVLLGKSDYDFFPKEEADVFWAKDEEVFASREIIVNEESFTSADNVTHVIQTVKSLFIAGNGDEYLVGTIRDITERKAAETKLSETTSRLTSLVSAMPDMVWMKDENGVYLSVNSAFEAFLGIPGRDLLGKTDDDIFEPEFAGVCKRSDMEALHAGDLSVSEERVVASTGIELILEVRKVPVYRNDGMLHGILGIGRDITERKRMEASIRALNATLEERVEERTAQLSVKEREYRTLAENLPDFLARYDQKCRRVYVNPAVTDYFGIPAKDLLGTTPEHKPLIGVPETFQQKLCDVLHSGKTADMETSNDRDGKKRWWNIIFTPELDDNGKSIGVLTIAHEITAIKEAEIELREREEKFYSVFRLSPAAISITSLERGCYLEVNESFLLHTKYTREEVVGKSSAELNIFANPEERAELFRQVAEEGYVSGLEYDFKAKDGSIGHAVAYGSVITLGGERCLLAHSYDNTPRKQLEALQQERLALEKRLSKIAEAAPGVNYIFALRPDGEMAFTYVAPGIEELIGISAETMIDDIDAATSNCHPEDHDGVLESLAVSARDLSMWQREYRILHPRKGIVWIEGQATPEREPDGTTVWYGFFHDVTERKATEQALHESEESFRAMVENSPDVISRYDLQGRRIYVNPMMQRLLDKPLEEILGTTPDEFSPLPSTARFKEHFVQVVSQGKEIEVESPYRLPNGEEGWGEHRIVPEFDHEGRVASVMVIGRDISDRKRSEQALKELNHSLEQRVMERTLELQQALAFNESIIHAIPDLLFEVDEEGTYLGIWGGDEKLLIEQREALLGNNIRNVLPPEAAQVAFKTIEEVDRQGYSRGNIYKLDLPDGEHWFELSTARKEPAGTYLALARDITERKQAAETIKELNATLERRVAERTAELQLLEGILDAAEETIWLFDIDQNGRLVYVNDAACRMLGYSRAELLHMGIAAVDKELNEPELQEMIATLMQTKHSLIKRRHTAKDGRVIPVEIDSTLLVSGKSTYVLSTARKIAPGDLS